MMDASTKLVVPNFLLIVCYEQQRHLASEYKTTETRFAEMLKKCDGMWIVLCDDELFELKKNKSRLNNLAI